MPHAPAPAALLLHPADDVAVVRQAVAAGAQLAVAGAAVTARRDIPAGHKVALRCLPAGATVRKYGQPIGVATADLAPGDHVHTHNLGLAEFARDYAFAAEARPAAPAPAETLRHFDGYLRPDGRVGTRNYLAILSTVNCSATVCRAVAERFRAVRRDHPHVDGVVAFTHKAGCAEMPGKPVELLQRVLAGMARHPNVFGFLVIGLGCEKNQVVELREGFRLNVLPPTAPAPAFLNIQDLGGVAKTIEAATATVARLLPQAGAARRSRQPAGKLTLALNCGGSDASSGITANPALGVASDELVRQGGAAVLGETPEAYGAEHLLTRRAVSREVGEKLLALIRWWEDHARLHGASIDNNPSPGNKAGGITTIYEKSLGAIAKGGTTPLRAVYHYAEPIDTPGLGFMDTPGFDPVSMTGLVAGGCTLGAFTTGRGSVYGCKPTPCLKIATNTALYEHMTDDMDLNAGAILDGTETVEQVGRRIFEELLAVASGKKTKSEAQGIGDEEFAPWVQGPTW